MDMFKDIEMNIDINMNIDIDIDIDVVCQNLSCGWQPNFCARSSARAGVQGPPQCMRHRTRSPVSRKVTRQLALTS